MKMFKNIMFAAALLAVNAVNAKGLGGKVQSTVTPKETQQEVTKSGIQTTTASTTPTPAQTAQTEAMQKEIETLKKQMAEQQKQQQQVGTQQPNTPAQRIQMQRLGQYLKQQPAVPAPAQKAEQGVSLEELGTGAYDRVKAFVYWGGNKLENMWASIKGAGSSMLESTTGTYGSSMGGYKYIAPFAIAVTAPYAGLVAGVAAGATTLWALGGAAVVLGVSNTFDRLNYAYKTGKLSEAAYLNELKTIIAVALNDQAAYPYYVSKIEALNSKTELYPVHTDEFGVAKKAHEALLNDCILAAHKEVEVQRKKEDLFATAVEDIRNKNNYANLSAAPSLYMEKLEAGNALINAQALVSEYNRARNKKNVQEKAAQPSSAKATEGRQATTPPVQQQPVQQKQVPVTTAPQGQPAGK